MERIDPKFVHPEDAQNMGYWSKKWGISDRELKDAILNTGTLRTAKLRNYLTRDSFFHHPFQGVRNLTNQLVHSIL